jgi:PST family polysaccharide transporter
MDNLKGKFVNAASWTVFLNATSQIVSIVFGVVLARLLVPDDFGLIAMASVFIGFATLLSDVGLGSALVRHQNLNEDYYSSVFWLNLFVGFFLTAIAYFLSDSIASFYGREEISSIIEVLSLLFIIRAAALVPSKILSKQLKFKGVNASHFIAMTLSGSLAIYMAASGYGIYALIAQQLTMPILAGALIFIISGWRPKFIYKSYAIKELLSFSVYVFLTQIVQYVAGTIDKLLTGKFLGADSVGYLAKSQSMMLFPIKNVSSMIGSVMFPALSSVQDDKKRVAKIYLKSVASIAAITFPMMAGMFAISENFVLGVLGSQWKPTIPIFMVLCSAGIINSVVTVTGSVFLSQGASKLQFHINLVTRFLLISLIVLGLQWGVYGVVIAFAVAAWISGIISLSFATRLIGLSLFDVVRKLSPVFFASILMGGLAYFLQLFTTELGHLTELALQICVGVVTYTLLVIFFQIEAIRDLLDVMPFKIPSAIRKLI